MHVKFITCKIYNKKQKKANQCIPMHHHDSIVIRMYNEIHRGTGKQRHRDRHSHC